MAEFCWRTPDSKPRIGAFSFQFYNSELAAKHVQCILSILKNNNKKIKNKCSKTRNSVQGNEGFQIRIQFSRAKSIVGTLQIHAPASAKVFDDMQNSSKCHLAGLCSMHLIITK